jgi:tripartite-type tricarboxylate transporter receptor subunit TctC
MIIRSLFAAGLVLGLAVHGVTPAQSQGYPTKPIRIVVPFPAGGPTDGMARLISDRLRIAVGQSVVVENQGGGAGGSNGAKFVAAADPDGYTVLLSPGGSLTTGPAVHKNIGYDPAKVFTPVAQLIETPQLVLVHPSLPVKTLQEVVAYAKAHPGKINWGTQGFGTGTHLMAEIFKLEAGLDMQHVPYRGTAPLLTAAIAGEVQVLIDPTTTCLPHVQSERLRAIAVAGPKRFPKLPEIPTAAEAGFPKLNSPFWLGMVAPAGTPPAIVDKLNAALRTSLADPEARQWIANLGAEVKIGTPDEFGKMLSEERSKWKAAVEAAHLSVN